MAPRSSSLILALGFLLLAVWRCSSLAANRINGTVYAIERGYDMLVPPGSGEYVYTVKLGVVDKENGAAYGYYEATENETGWGVMNIAAGYASGRTTEDKAVMTAAGMLEGALTYKQLYLLFLNLNGSWFRDMPTEKVQKIAQFYSEQALSLHGQRSWMEGMIGKYANSSETWHYMELIYSQWLGLQMGYKWVEDSSPLPVFAFDFLSGQGDLLDIVNFAFEDQRPDWSTITREQYRKLLIRGGHCSVLIKMLPGYENVFASHSTWFIYASMNRIYKHYAFNIGGSPATKVMSFSSYPGILSSWDDFYIMDSGLVMLQTTNSILNKTLYDQATPQALLAWHRVRLANWLASGGKEWAKYITDYNSGTYNNQYMVLDLKRIELKKGIHDNALWVVEQIPGYVASGDQSPILRAGYWPSYNVPFYEYVYNMSGYPETVARVGPDASYQLAPRAKIFRRDQGNVVDLQSMKYLMRYNDYKNDPYSEDDPAKAICARADLSSKPGPMPFGCTDTKVTDYSMARVMAAVAENGPTHQGLPPFDWGTSELDAPHIGQRFMDLTSHYHNSFLNIHFKYYTSGPPASSKPY